MNEHGPYNDAFGRSYWLCHRCNAQHHESRAHENHLVGHMASGYDNRHVIAETAREAREATVDMDSLADDLVNLLADLS